METQHFVKALTHKWPNSSQTEGFPHPLCWSTRCVFVVIWHKYFISWECGATLLPGGLLKLKFPSICTVTKDQAMGSPGYNRQNLQLTDLAVAQTVDLAGRHKVALMVQSYCHNTAIKAENGMIWPHALYMCIWWNVKLCQARWPKRCTQSSIMGVGAVAAGPSDGL